VGPSHLEAAAARATEEHLPLSGGRRKQAAAARATEEHLPCLVVCTMATSRSNSKPCPSDEGSQLRSTCYPLGRHLETAAANAADEHLRVESAG
jgi:hypothetical protein